MSGGAHPAVPMPSSSRSCCCGTSHCLHTGNAHIGVVCASQRLVRSCDSRVLTTPAPPSPVPRPLSCGQCLRSESCHPLLGLRTLLCSLLTRPLVWPPAGWYLVQMLCRGRCDKVQIGLKASPFLRVAICLVPRDAAQFSHMPLDVGTMTAWPWTCLRLCRVQ